MIWLARKLPVVKHFMIVVTNVATGRTSVTDMLLAKMVIQVMFCR